MQNMSVLVHQLVDTFAERHPAHLAVLEAGQQLSYGELVGRANGLARALRGAGVRHDEVVAVCLPRGADFVTAVLGVLKAGAAYLPLEPGAPVERRADMIVQVQARHVVVAGPQDGLPAHLQRLDLARIEPDEQFASVPVRPEHLAYVMFTSGSSGRPKGVMVSHGALANMASAYREVFALEPEDRTMLGAQLSFDASVGELWPFLTAGAGVCVPEDKLWLDTRALAAWLREHRVTVAFLPTPMAELALAVPWEPQALRLLFTAGDRLHSRPPPQLPFQLVNLYGPTENTVGSTFSFVQPGRPGAPPIGVALPGVQVHVLDPELRPVRPGEEGEIYLGGENVARGYVGHASATAERFVPDPFAGGGRRMYRTGDRGRWRPDGELDFCGRTDQQVKIRGVRVEPAEVVLALLGHPQVAAAHVVARSDGGDKRLVAYITPRDPRRVPDPRQLREHLAPRLLPVMHPEAFVVLDALPLTTHGKVDVARLPEPPSQQPATSRPYAEPETELERQLAALWAQLLRVVRVGLDDDFFELGGHSLLAIRTAAGLADTLAVPVSVRDLFACPTVRQLAARLARGPEAHLVPPPLVPGSGGLRAPLTVQQEQVWFFQQLAPDSTAYQAQTTVRLVGRFDPDVLERALDEIVRRHALLRTLYREQDGQVWQLVQPPEPVRMVRIDLSSLEGEELVVRREQLVKEELAHPFDLGQLPLARWTLLRLAPEEHELVLVEHHIVHDGWSFAVLTRELQALYTAFAEGQPSVLPELEVQYADYAVWQRLALDSPAMEQQLSYWRGRLQGAPPALELPTDRRRPPVQSFRGDLLRIELPAELPAALRTFCRRQGVTLYSTLFAAFAALLQRYTGQTDLCIGSAFANREPPQVESLVGMFVNLVVLRCEVDPRAPFGALVQHVRDVVVEAAAHQMVPFPKVVEALSVRRDPSRNPLVQAMFSFHDSPVTRPRLGDASSTIFERGNGSAKMDLDVVVIPHAGRHLGDREHGDARITILWEYNRDLFDRSTMEQMSACYLRLLRAALERPEVAVGRLPLWEPARERQPPLRSLPPVHETVVQRAAASPEALAVQHGAVALSYGELAQRSASLARELRRRGAGPEQLVAICLPRGIDLVVAELGVLRSGAAVLPLDPSAPPSRQAQLLQGARVELLITDRAHLALHPQALVLQDLPPDDAPLEPVPLRESHLAYVLYTSGSTGQPKAVMVPHGALAHLSAWHQQAFGLGETSRATLLYAPSVDPSLAELWPTLSAGASLHVPEDETRLSPERLVQWLCQHQLTHTDLPAILAERVLALDWPARCSLAVLLSGGDRLSRRPSVGLPFEVHNEYGPTEATVTATSGRVSSSGEGPVGIGHPRPGVTAWVLDPELAPVPPGVVGELYLGGVGVTRGYLHRASATAERFVPDPLSGEPGARMYRTGDRVRQRPDGLEFVGRVDGQVKIRGVRVEPAEVAAALLSHPQVAAAHVVARPGPDGQLALVAYAVPQEGAVLHGPGLREHLSTLLPSALVPAACVPIDTLPFTPQGKVDASALPSPSLAQAQRGEPPATPLERELVAVWAQVLRAPSVGVTDNFFDLGGHSLLLAEVQRQVEGLVDRPVPLILLFEHPTIRGLARHLEGQARPEAAPSGRDPAGRARLQDRRSRLTRGGQA
jgi:amino acid adenylation domain-containing protein